MGAFDSPFIICKLKPEGFKLKGTYMRKVKRELKKVAGPKRKKAVKPTRKKKAGKTVEPKKKREVLMVSVPVQNPETWMLVALAAILWPLCVVFCRVGFFLDETHWRILDLRSMQNVSFKEHVKKVSNRKLMKLYKRSQMLARYNNPEAKKKFRLIKSELKRRGK